jgi:hypothetical protein
MDSFPSAPARVKPQRDQCRPSSVPAAFPALTNGSVPQGGYEPVSKSVFDTAFRKSELAYS